MSESRAIWNPRDPVDISPDEYEKQVVRWIRDAGATIDGLTVDHQEMRKGMAGEYALDGFAKFQILAGAEISVLIECKKHRHPIKRDIVLGVHSKTKDIGAHKAMVFSTSGFQKGAIEYAAKYGIALVTFVNGTAMYFTKSAEPVGKSHYPDDLPDFAGQMISLLDEGSVSIKTIDLDDLSYLTAWFVA